MLSQLGADRSKQASASIASRVYPNNSLSGQLVQSGGTRDRGVNIVSVPTKSGRLATMLMLVPNVSISKCFYFKKNGNITEVQ